MLIIKTMILGTNTYRFTAILSILYIVFQRPDALINKINFHNANKLIGLTDVRVIV